MVFLSPAQWLSGILRTPIFHDYVARDYEDRVREENLAREFALWGILPVVIVYNILISLMRPQTLIIACSCCMGPLILLLAGYVAYLDYIGGKRTIEGLIDLLKHHLYTS